MMVTLIDRTLARNSVENSETMGNEKTNKLYDDIYFNL